MRFRSLACLLATGLMAAAPAAAEELAPPEGALDPLLLARAAELRERAAGQTRAFELVRSLTQEVGPRLAGSAGDRAAVAWALTTLGDLGFVAVRAEDVAVPRWERGATAVQLISPFSLRLAAETLGGSVGTPEDGIEAPVLGVRDLAELTALSEDQVAGRIVYIGQRMRRTADLAGYREVVGNRVHGPAVAAERGAVGVVIRSTATSDHRLAHTGATRYRERVRPIPAFALANADADLIEHHLAAGAPVSLRLYSSARSLGTARSANVIGEIRGRSRPEEIVLLGAHLDSWDLGTGAVDAAAGVAIAIEAARLVASAGRPERTLRVVLFANEESGATGARDYLRRHANQLAAHMVALEADQGAAPVLTLHSRVPDSALPVVDALQALLLPLGVERGGNEAFGGVDIAPLRDRGVPVLELAQDLSRYFDWHHSASDTLDKVDPEELARVVAAWSAVVYVLANMPGDLGRLPLPDSGG